MTPITPEALRGQSFSKTEFGDDPAEVDAHIRRLTENYSLLYRENASLLKQLRETGEKYAQSKTRRRMPTIFCNPLSHRRIKSLKKLI